MNFMRTAMMLLIFTILSNGCAAFSPLSKPSASKEIDLNRPYRPGTPAEFPIRSKEIAPGTFLLTGRGANSVAVATSDGWILVDTKLMYPAAYDELKAALKKRNDQEKILAVFVTHHHADHTGGNRFALQDGASIFGQINVGPTLKRYVTRIAPVNPSPPTTFFQDRLDVEFAGVSVEAYHFGLAHTNGDSVIYFPHTKVLAAGDLVYGSGELAVDMVDGQGSLIGMLSRLDDILKIDFEILAPGHGDNVLTRREVELYRDRLSKLIERGKAAVKAGVSVDELRNAMRSDDLGFRLVGHFWEDPKYLVTRPL